MTAQFTPGPWTVSGCAFGPGADDVSYFVVAEGMDASAANARLIANATKLFEALAEALPIMEARAPDYNETIARIRSVIAEVEGDA